LIDPKDHLIWKRAQLLISIFAPILSLELFKNYATVSLASLVARSCSINTSAFNSLDTADFSAPAIAFSFAASVVPSFNFAIVYSFCSMIAWSFALWGTSSFVRYDGFIAAVCIASVFAISNTDEFRAGLSDLSTYVT
jgi:hypothetical protein